ncbi:MAG: aldose 1-epimerase family protein [Eubacteriales bacterium]|nr:aldose 1-epimerase family protein [Eubacteriales bacterium]
MRAIDVKTGSGFHFTVLPTRGMDISWADYKGEAISFISKAGVTHPAYFEKDGLSFLRSFFCGLLTTCGLTYFGAPCTDEGEKLGLHGRISNIPAQNVCVQKCWDGNDYIMRISGRVVESSMFGENLMLTRVIETKMGSSELKIKDTIENMGFNEQPFMLLYHCNFGYPLVDENTVLQEPEGTVVHARDEEGVVEKCFEFQKPTHDYNEQVFYHNIPGDIVRAVLYNKERKLGAYVEFSKKQFSHFGEWKMMGEGDYVVGLEPSNAIPEGRDVVRRRGELEYIQPGEKKVFEFSIGIVDDRD